MLIDNARTEPPKFPENTLRVKFKRPWKYSPRGFDMRKCKKGEILEIPQEIADAALEDKDINGIPAIEILGSIDGEEEVEVVTQPDKPELKRKKG